MHTTAILVLGTHEQQAIAQKRKLPLNSPGTLFDNSRQMGPHKGAQACDKIAHSLQSTLSLLSVSTTACSDPYQATPSWFATHQERCVELYNVLVLHLGMHPNLSVQLDSLHVEVEV